MTKHQSKRFYDSSEAHKVRCKENYVKFYFFKFFFQLEHHYFYYNKQFVIEVSRNKIKKDGEKANNPIKIPTLDNIILWKIMENIFSELLKMIPNNSKSKTVLVLGIYNLQNNFSEFQKPRISNAMSLITYVVKVQYINWKKARRMFFSPAFKGDATALIWPRNFQEYTLSSIVAPYIWNIKNCSFKNLIFSKKDWRGARFT